MQTPDSIIFDMDGTLWDAVDSYVWIWNESFRQLGLSRRFDRDSLLGMMGKQPDEIIRECLDGEAATVDVDLVYRTVFGLQERTMLLLGGRLYDGVRSGLERLASRYRLFLLSNCESYGARQFLEYTRLGHLFEDSLTFGETRLPKALNMRLLCERHGLAAPVYVGDTDSDRRQTEAAGLPFVFVSYGFGRAERADLTFDNFPSLEAYFMGL